MLKNHYLYYTLIIFLISSCHKKTKVSGSPEKDIADPVVESVVKDTPAAVYGAYSTFIDSLNDRYINFDQVEMNGKAEVTEGGETTNASVIIRMIKDQIIWMSFRKFGMEGVRLFANNDSIVVLNRLDKEYSVIKYDKLDDESGLRLNIGILQSSLLGKVAPLTDGPNRLQKDSVANRLYLERNDVTWIYDVHPVDMLTLGLNILSRKKQNAQFNASFGDNRRITNGKYLPFAIKYKINIDGNSPASLNLSIDDVDLSSKKTVPFDIPGGYKLVGL